MTKHADQREILNRIFDNNDDIAATLLSLMNNLPGAVYRGLRDWSLVFISIEAERITGYTSSEFMQGLLCWKDLIHPDDLERVQVSFRDAVRKERRVLRTEYRFCHRDGTYRWFEDRRQMIYDEEGSFVYVDGLILDITEFKHTEIALRESEEMYRRLVETANDAIFIADAEEGIIIDVNRKAEKLIGKPASEMIGIHHIHLHPPEEADRYRAIFKEHAEKRMAVEEELFVCHKNGRNIPVEVSASLVEFGGRRLLQGIFRDISERKKMEMEMLKTEKLESLGMLAGGLAHDFNNLLTSILGNISMAKMITDPGEKIHENLLATEKAAMNAKYITQQLLTFSKGGVPIKESASIKEIIVETARFILRGSNVGYKFDIPDDLWDVEVDKGQISQVINNLIINADHAMPDGGTIFVRCKNVILAGDEGIPLDGGKYIVISIEDHGIGIAGEYLPKIFDPYFTTKQMGSGIGLTTAYSIVKKHDGHITVESTPGAGTTFHVYLPSTGQWRAERRAEREMPVAGRGKVLVMDDEADIRRVASEMLQNLGYDVDVARDGREAIALYTSAMESDAPFDAIIMDLTIPGGMGGEETIKKLLELDGSAKAIVSSGYSSDPIMANAKEFGFVDLLVKPYRMSDLSETVYRVINLQR